MTQESPTLNPPEAPPPAEMETPSAPAAPAETPQEPAAPAEGAEEVTEPTVEAPAWANVTAEQGIDALFEVEDVKAHHERKLQEARDEGYQTLQSHMQPTLQANQQQLAQIGEASEAILARLNKVTREGALDEDAISTLLREHKGAFAALNGAYQAVGYWEGIRQYVQGLTQASGDLGLSQPFVERLSRMQHSTRTDPITGERQPVADPTFLPDFYKKLSAKARQEGYDEGHTKGLKESKAAQAASQQVQGAKGAGPNLAPGSPAGGRSDAELLKDPTTSVEKLIEIRARQRAAGE